MATRMVYRHQGQTFQQRIPKYISAGVNLLKHTENGSDKIG